MIIKSLYTHPIKSLRPLPLHETVITSTGPLHDRQFMLIRSEGEQDENMHISKYSQLCLFSQEFYPAGSTSENAEGVLVTYTPPEKPRGDGKGERAKNGVCLANESRILQVPFCPDTSGLARRKVVMYGADCLAYDMGDDPYSEFFRGCLGIEVRLLFLGEGEGRTPLGNMAPDVSKKGRGGILSRLGLTSGDGGQERGSHKIKFSECAPLLVTTEWSLGDVSRRFKEPGGEGMDMAKFRPNIVLGDGSSEDDVIQAWDEDFWAELAIYPQKPHGDSHKILLTQNCARCRAINVEYDSGEFGDVKLAGGEEPLKYLMKDRRVDPGAKWSPVFGRYGFLDGEGEIKVAVGDRVEVARKNEERTVFYWPGLSTEPSS